MLLGALLGTTATASISTIEASCRADHPRAHIVAAWETRATNMRIEPKTRNCLLTEDGDLVEELAMYASAGHYAVTQTERVPVARITSGELVDFYGGDLIAPHAAAPKDVLWPYGRGEDVALDGLRIDF